MNRVFLSGRLTNAVEIKTSASGGSYCNFSIACDKYAGKDKEKKTIFVNCMAFAHSANFLAKYCNKGSMVFIEGELDCNVKEKDGNKVTYWNVICNNVEAIKPQKNEDSAPVSDGGDNLPFEL